MSRTQTLLVIGGKLAVWLCHDLKQRLSISGFKHWQWPWDILSQSSRLLQQMQTAARNATRENPNMHKLRTRKHTAIWREKTLDYAPAWKLAPIRSSRSFAWHFADALPFKDHKILPQNSKVSLWTSRLFIFNSCSLIFFHSRPCFLCPPLQVRSKPVLWGEIAWNWEAKQFARMSNTETTGNSSISCVNCKKMWKNTKMQFDQWPNIFTQFQSISNSMRNV